MIKIACVGIAVQDRIYYVDEMPKVNGKFVATDYKEIGGGPAATAAVAIAKLGAKVDFIGRVGDDGAGKVIVSELNSYGVNTSLVKVYPNARSSQSAILVDKQGERLIINYPSPDLLYDTDWLEGVDFSGYDAILADVRWPQGTEYCFKKGQELGIPTILDADITPQDITALVALSTHAAFSEPGLFKMTALNEVESALKKGSLSTDGKVYVTLGDKGCLWLEGGEKHWDKGFKVDVVDTTGAGDVFHGAFAFALANGYSTDKVVEFACAVAALKCTKAGGRAGIPTIEQVNNFLNSYQR
ncbi:sugar kinase [Orbus mooreae]|uniref:sugar kinase n=1 Tax=Orbus mooreae TaxID=3074107 RepID=UPI00370D4059